MKRVWVAAAAVVIGCLGLGGAASASPVPAASAAPTGHGGALSPRPEIVGGSVAGPGSFPWLAFIEMRTATGYDTCSGTVISPNLVLTAAHCVYDVEAGSLFPPSSYAVVTGSLDWTNAAARQLSGVSQTFLAPGYDPATDDHDIGILELRTPTTAPAIRLATSGSLLSPGAGVAIAGWGLTVAGDTASLPAQLRWAPTVVQNGQFCGMQAAEAGAVFDASAQLCTIDAPYDATSFCNGDSGGPVIADYLQGEPDTPTEIGVINESGGCATDQADFSARVDAVASWAEQLIRRLAPSATAAPPAPGTPGAPPAVSLGALSIRAGRSDARTVLNGVFRGRFADGRRVRLRCHRGSQTAVSCAINWRFGPNVYAGSVRVYLLRWRGRVVWSDHYFIRWFNNRCAASRSRRSCRVRRRAGRF